MWRQTSESVLEKVCVCARAYTCVLCEWQTGFLCAQALLGRKKRGVHTAHTSVDHVHIAVLYVHTCVLSANS